MELTGGAAESCSSISTSGKIYSLATCRVQISFVTEAPSGAKHNNAAAAAVPQVSAVSSVLPFNRKPRSKFRQSIVFLSLNLRDWTTEVLRFSKAKFISKVAFILETFRSFVLINIFSAVVQNMFLIYGVAANYISNAFRHRVSFSVGQKRWISALSVMRKTPV